MQRLRLLVFISSLLAHASAQGGAYEAELRRRQYEYQQQQMLRAQQQQQQYQQGGGAAQAQAEAYARQQRAAQQAQMARQQLMMEAAMQQAQRERAALNAADGKGKKLSGQSKKEREKLEKLQKQREKEMKKAQANRQKAFQAAQKQAQRQPGARKAPQQRYGGGGAMRADRGSSGLTTGKVLKLTAVVGGVGFLWINQRPLLLKVGGMTLKYPLLIARLVLSKAWTLLLKPVIRQVLVLRSSSKGGAAAVGGELPGGAY